MLVLKNKMSCGMRAGVDSAVDGLAQWKMLVFSFEFYQHNIGEMKFNWMTT